MKVQKIDNVRENLSNFKRESDLNQKGKITLPKNKSRRERFRQVLEDVAKNAITTEVKR